MSTANFELGVTVFKSDVSDLYEQNRAFKSFVNISLGKYMKCDWGDTYCGDQISNNEALKSGGRIVAEYKDKENDWSIRIITEEDRSKTTVLFGDN